MTIVLRILTDVFPLKLRWLLQIPFINADKNLPLLLRKINNPNVAAADHTTVIERAVPPKLSVKITEVIPRLREGGAFVKFSHSPGEDLAQIEEEFKTYLKENPIKPWFNPLRRVRTRVVRGRPWIEDLYRFPSSRLKVEFLPGQPGAEAAELSQETLYTLFRRYGKLSDIVAQPTDSKVLPKYATLDFQRIRHAVMARNCMHGFVLVEEEGGGKGGTLLNMTYQQRIKAHWIRDWLVQHPRIVIPALIALATGITVAVFDPIRTFFIKTHVSKSYLLDDSKIYKWLRAKVMEAGDAFSSFAHRNREESTGLDVIWEDRGKDIEQIRTWLIETADTFIVVQGPRGSGKKELVIDQALSQRKHKLVIDCKPIQEAHGDSATISAAAKEVGYKPIFSWMNSMSSLIDLAAQGTIGAKTGFSETLDSQLAKIWQNTATALKEIALETRKKDDKDHELSADEWLEAHPERRPVVVIDNFLHKSNESSLVYDKLSEWAAGLTTANIAHVIFLTHDVSFSKSLSRALPDRVFRQISLGDCSPEVAKRFVINHIDSDPDDLEEQDGVMLTPSQRRRDLAELDGSIEILGGRLTDLEFLARRIKTGETPKNAVTEMIKQSASEILKMYILDVDTSTRHWTPEQAWLLIKELVNSGDNEEGLRYNALLLSDIFKTSGETVLQALEQAELITISSSNGRPRSIKPGKPVYSAAFKALTEDKVLSARMDLAILTKLIAVETQGIDKYEKELELLGTLPKQPSELGARVSWLLGKVRAGQEKVEKYERDSAGMKIVLMGEY